MVRLRSVNVLLVALSAGGAMSVGTAAFAQQIQVPTLQVCNATTLSANAYVIIDTRATAPYSGFVSLRGKLGCDPASGAVYPAGALGLFGISMNDSQIQGDVTFTTFEQVTSGGKVTPTLWVNGRCRAAQVRGCHYWLMAVDNVEGQPVNKTYDVVSFLILDENGKRIAYGTGNVVDGDLTITSAN